MKHNQNGQNGFTLIELMIVVAVVAILSAVAFPGYQQYVIRGNRSAAQAQMMDIANREQQYFMANKGYATQTELGYTVPSDLSAKYTSAIVVSNTATPPTFTITFTAIGSQATDGDLTLNNNGVKTPAEKWK